MALTEDQAKEIRKLGISVIEWKRCAIKSMDVASHIFNKVVATAEETWKRILEVAKELVDAASLALGEIKEKLHYPTSIRHKFVKILGAMGYDKQRAWTLIRRTWLARSNC